MSQNKMELIGEAYHDSHKWEGAVLEKNGCIYGIPHNARQILKIDPFQNTTSLVGDDVGSGQYKWFGGVDGKNGFIYGVPFNANSILQYNIEGEETKLIKKNDPLLDSILKFSGGVLAPNKCIYFIPSANYKVLKFNPSNGNLIEIGDDLGREKLKFYGGVLGSDGNIYCIPYRSKKVLKITVNDDSIKYIGDEYRGEFKWKNGILARNGKIYACPNDAKQILEINTFSQTTSLVGSDLGVGMNKWTGFVHGADETLYGTPSHADDILCYDTVLNMSNSFRMPKEIQKDMLLSFKWSSGVQTENNTFFFIPLDHPQVLKFTPHILRRQRPQALGTDSETGKDCLDRMNAMFSAANLMARKDQKLPYAFGISGSWGAGKSFAVNLFLARLQEIYSTDLRGPSVKESFPFVGHIYVIKFNAWAYHKSELWSSLMITILKQLSDQFRFEEMLRRKVEEKSQTELLNGILLKFWNPLNDTENENVEEMLRLSKKALETMGFYEEIQKIDRFAKTTDEEHKLNQIKNLLREKCLQFVESKYTLLQASNKESDLKEKERLKELGEFLDMFLHYEQQSKMKFLCNEMIYSTKSNLVKGWKKIKSTVTFWCMSMFSRCIQCFSCFRGFFVYVESRNRNWASIANEREPLLQNERLSVIPDRKVPSEEMIDNSILIKGGFNMMKIMEDVNGKEMEVLKEKKPEVYKRVKLFKKTGDANSMLKDLVNETYEDDKKKLKFKQHELKKKKDKLAWKLTSKNSTKQGAQLISAIYEKLNDNEGNDFPESFEEAWKKMNLSDTRREFWKVRTGSIWWYSALLLFLIVSFVIYIFHDRLKEIEIILHDQINLLLLSPFVTLVLPFVGKVSTFVNQLKEAKKSIAKAVQNPDQLISENEDLEASDPDLEQLKQLNNEVSSIKDRIWLNEGDELSEAISQRLEKYKDRLGVVHQAQKDLQALTNAMLNEKNQSKYFPRGKPRIFLFIDDLDRCSPRKAVEVLEAIQLLLKTEIFVTIVALDLKYMEACLEQHDEYKGILQENRCPSGLHYLEKILQLTYRIPSIMEKEQMKNYLEGQLTAKNENKALIDEKRKNELNKRKVHARIDSQIEVKEFENENVEKDFVDSTNQSDAATLIFHEDVSYEDEEIDFVAKACTDARASPRNTRRVLSSFKLLKEIWKTSGDIPDNNARDACIVLLSICASNDMRVRVGMKKAFWKLEHDLLLPRVPKSGVATFLTFWEMERKFLVDDQDLPKPIKELMTKYFNLPWNDWKKYFWETRSFSFVGDYAQFSTDQEEHLAPKSF